MGLKGDISMPKAWCFFSGILRPKRKKSYLYWEYSAMSKWRIFI